VTNCIRDLRLWLRLGCVEMRGRVIQTVHRRGLAPGIRWPYMSAVICIDE
jgi:hypothetical protein